MYINRKKAATGKSRIEIEYQNESFSIPEPAEEKDLYSRIKQIGHDQAFCKGHEDCG